MENLDYTTEIDLGLAKILVLANRINRKTEMCCFVNDTAHCRYLEIRLHKDVKSYAEVGVTFKVYYDEQKYDKDNENRLDEVNRCVEFLQDTLKANSIPYELCHEVKKLVTVEYKI